MIDPHFVIVAAVFNVLGGLSYLIATLKGQVKPNRVTWFLWAVVPLIAFVAEIKQGVGLTSLMTFMVGFNPALIFCASFLNKKAEWKLSRFDIGCGALSVLGIVLWRITGTGNIAILMSILADGFAAIPTIVKAYKAPKTENYLVYLGGAISAVITLLTIKSWTLAFYGFPLYILFVTALMVFLIKSPRKAL